jgi:hypothetical protein
MIAAISDRVFLDLIAAGTVGGRDATRADYDDAVRAVVDQQQRYYQLDDPIGEALCHVVAVQLLAAASRRGPVVPF